MKTVAIALVALAGLFLLSGVTPTTTPSVPISSQTLAIPLVNQQGQTFRLARYRGSYVFVSFFFARCPQSLMCPLTISLTQGLVRKWRKNPLAPLHILGVTLDPEHDTPERLRLFGEGRKLNFRHFSLVTGTPDRIAEFASYYNVVALPGAAILSHNVRSVLLDPKGHQIATFDENQWNAEQVLDVIRTHSKKTDSHDALAE